MTDANTGHAAYRQWTHYQAEWAQRNIDDLHLAEELAEGLREALLTLIEVALDIRNDFVIPGEVLLSLHGELNALFKGFEPIFLIPESRRHPNKMGSPKVQSYVKTAVAWIRSADGRGQSVSEARALVRTAFAVSKATVSAWEVKYPDAEDNMATERLVATVGRLYRDAANR